MAHRVHYRMPEMMNMTQAAVSANPTAGSMQKRVLIVEDDDSVASLYCRALGLPDYLLYRATNGEDALCLLENNSFDAVVSDLMMPGMSGVDLLKSVRNHHNDVPFVIVTGRPAVESAITAVECGAFRYLVKPLLLQELREAVAHAVEAHEVKQLSKGAHPPPAEIAEGRSTENDSDFRDALETLFMAYQPIVKPSLGSILGYEALIRTRPARYSQPKEFLEAAARRGALKEVGRRVRRAVAADLEKLPSESLVFVNHHVEELFDPALYSDANPLRKHARRVVLELTEQGQLAGVEARAAALRNRGFLIAVDDLGAGYSSLSLLAGLKPDFVKIDRDLVRGVDMDSTKRTLIASLATACRELRVELVCEGVETEGEGRALLEIGVELLQGYLFARPQRSFSPDERLLAALSTKKLVSHPTGHEERI